MALIKCPNCKKEISDTTKKCIHCKKRLDGKNDVITPKRIKIAIIVVIVLIIGIISIKQIVKTFNYHKSFEKQEKTTNIEDNNNNNNEEIIDNNIENNSNNEIEDNKNESNVVEKNKTEETKKETTPAKEKQNNSNNKQNVNNDNSQKTDIPSESNTTKSITYAYSRKVCPSSYEMFSGANSCVKKDYKSATIEYYCVISGDELIGTKCKSSHTFTPVNGSCLTSSYVLENDVCVSYSDALQRKVCPNDYKLESSYSNNCVKTESIAPIVEYYCPDGYTLNGTNCEK